MTDAEDLRDVWLAAGHEHGFESPAAKAACALWNDACCAQDHIVERELARRLRENPDVVDVLDDILREGAVLVAKTDRKRPQ